MWLSQINFPIPNDHPCRPATRMLTRECMATWRSGYAADCKSKNDDSNNNAISEIRYQDKTDTQDEPDNGRNHRPRFCDIRGKWLSQAALSTDLKPADLRILVWMANEYANALTGECYPSQERLMKELRLNKRTVQRALSRLEELRWFEVERGNGRTNHSKYFLSFEKVDPNVVAFTRASKKGGLRDRGQNKGRSVSPKRAVCQSHKGRSVDRPNHKRNQNKNQHGREAVSVSKGWYALNRDDVQSDHWHTWMRDHGFSGFDGLPSDDGDGEQQRRVPNAWPPDAHDDGKRETVMDWLAFHGVVAEKGSARHG